MTRQSPTAKPIPIGQPIVIERDDLSLLHQGNRTTSSIQRLRASHHRMARLAAYGFTNKEIAANTGYTKERIGQLLGSPAMKELVAVYESRIEEKDVENLDAFLSLKTSNMIAAERHIADHIAELDDVGELLPVKTALAISADGADRTGYGKRTTNLNVNMDFAFALEKAIKRSGKEIKTVGGQMKQVEGRPPPPLAATTSALPRPQILRRA